MHQVSAPGHTWHQYPSIAALPVVRVYTVTIVDEAEGGARRLIGAVQHRSTMTYNRRARAVGSVPPAVLDIRL